MASSSTAAASGRAASPIPVDPNAPIFVAGAVVSTAVLGAITGASIGVVRSQNPYALSVNMAANSGLVGLAFFGLREYVVSPALVAARLTPTHARRADALSARARGKLPDAEPAASISDVRAERLADSALAGALSGGALSWGLRGRHTALRAGLTASLIATLVQLSVNQVRIVRLQLLASRAQAGAGAGANDAGANAGTGTGTGTGTGAAHRGAAAARVDGQGTVTRPADRGAGEKAPPGFIPTSAPSVGPAISLVSSSASALGSSPSASSRPASSSPTSSSPDEAAALPAEVDIYASLAHPLKPPAETRGSAPLSARILGALATFLPVRRLSDADYAAQLERKRAEIRRRLGEIKEEEQRMFEWAEKGPRESE
ncbi:hypothetical protein Q5752_002556 [Cryptotrichosporon argae]